MHLSLDRVGPDPFDPAGLGPIVTVRWPVRVGTVAGAARLWLPESVVNHWLAAPTRAQPPDSQNRPTGRKPWTRRPVTLRRVQTGALGELLARRGRLRDHVARAQTAAAGRRLAARRFAA